MAARRLAAALASFGAILLVLSFTFAWQNGTVAIAVICTVAGAIVAALLIKAFPPNGGPR